MKKIKLIILAAALSLFALPALAQTDSAGVLPTQERIISYDSQVQVNADASLIVAETIKVYAANDQISHGIYRDFPTRYKDRYGHNYNVGFKVIGVTKDGVDENFWTESQSNGVRIYIGQKDVLLEPGEYIYQIIYQTTRQLGFFNDHDELYWNVTGNGWVFPIEKATAQVIIPGAVPEQLKLDGFTGPQGATDKNFNIDLSSGQPFFATVKPLGAHEGLTIVVGWPKGIIAEPALAQKLRYFFSDNAGAIVGLVGLLIILLYFLVAWERVGRDPRRGTIIPQYEPPTGFSPALAGYVMKLGYSQKLFSAAVISAAVKGFLKISKNGKYKFTKIGPAVSLAAEESAIMDEILGDRQEIDVKNSNHDAFGAATSKFQLSLAAQGQKKYFTNNLGYWLLGLALSLLILIAAILLGPQREPGAAIFLSFWVTFWSLGVYLILKQAAAAWKLTGGKNKKAAHLAQAVFISLFSLPFIAGEIFGLVFLFYSGSVFSALLLVAVVAVNVAFFRWLKAPSVLGRKMMDEIEGFQWFLTVTEKDRMNFHNPPEKTPELFEKYLPYALALGVENEWAEQFAEVFNQLHEAGRDYSPAWYYGAFSALAISDFTSAVGSSLSSAISSSAVAPGSSSGFGGGGGSGGGGGGGGGGGW